MERSRYNIWGQRRRKPHLTKHPSSSENPKITRKSVQPSQHLTVAATGRSQALCNGSKEEIHSLLMSVGARHQAVTAGKGFPTYYQKWKCYSTEQTFWFTRRFFIFCFQTARLPCNLLKWCWEMVLRAFLRVFQSFSGWHWLLFHLFSIQSLCFL